MTAYLNISNVLKLFCILSHTNVIGNKNNIYARKITIIPLYACTYTPIKMSACKLL